MGIELTQELRNNLLHERWRWYYGKPSSQCAEGPVAGFNVDFKLHFAAICTACRRTQILLGERQDDAGVHPRVAFVSVPRASTVAEVGMLKVRLENRSLAPI